MGVWGSTRGPLQKQRGRGLGGGRGEGGWKLVTLQRQRDDGVIGTFLYSSPPFFFGGVGSHRECVLVCIRAMRVCACVYSKCDSS